MTVIMHSIWFEQTKKNTSFLLFFSVWFVSSNYIIRMINVTEAKTGESQCCFFFHFRKSNYAVSFFFSLLEPYTVYSLRTDVLSKILRPLRRSFGGGDFQNFSL